MMLLLSSVTFIMLSVGAVWTAELRRCYWCGPLAEQVHRSRRAPACDDLEPHITICDPGYHYCVIVATAPPYVESRYCAKIYQDECYTLFCNSTKTWRMTCPCRGDLCNGPNTNREVEAFEILSELVATSPYSRIKRKAIVDDSNLALSSNLNSEDPNQNEENVHNDENTVIDDTNDIKTLDQVEQDEATTSLTTEIINIQESTTTETDAKPVVDSTPETLEKSNNINEVSSNLDENHLQEMQGDQPASDTNDVPLKEMIKDEAEVGMEKVMEAVTTDMPTKIEEPLDPLVKAESQLHDESLTENPILNMVAKDIGEIIVTTSSPSIENLNTISTKETLKSNDNANTQSNDLSFKEMPNAESLQHDQAPTEKPVVTQAQAATTVGDATVTLATETSVVTTTEHYTTIGAITTMKSQKNRAISHNIHNTIFFYATSILFLLQTLN